MKKILALFLALGMLFTLAAPASAVSTLMTVPKSDDLGYLFQSNSYWAVYASSMDFYAEKIVEMPTYYLELETSANGANLVSVNADDYRQASDLDWEYDEETGILRIYKLEDGWNPPEFFYRDGVFVCSGAYYETILKPEPDAQAKYNATFRTFRENYGKYNPAKRLISSNAMDRYRPLSDWDVQDYESFRYVAMQRSFGIVGPEDEEHLNEIREEISKASEISKNAKIIADRVLFDIDLPKESDGVLRYGRDANVINLVFPSPADPSDTGGYAKVYEAFMLMPIERMLRQGGAEKHNMSERCRFVWNDEEALALVFFGPNIVLFRGPTNEIQFMTQYLDLDGGLWKY